MGRRRWCHTINLASPLPALHLRAHCRPSSREEEGGKETLILKKRPYVVGGEAAGCGRTGSKTTTSPGLKCPALPLTAAPPRTRSFPWCCRETPGLSGWDAGGGSCTGLSGECCCKQLPTSPSVRCLRSESSLHQEQGKYVGFSFTATMHKNIQSACWQVGLICSLHLDELLFCYNFMAVGKKKIHFLPDPSVQQQYGKWFKVLILEI